MKILIIRCYPSIVDINKYNLQEIGLAKALIRKGNKCDIVYYCKDPKNREQFIEVDGSKQKIKIYWRKGINILGNVYYSGLLKEKFINNYDIVQLSEYNQIYTYYFNKKVNKPCIIYHGPYDCEFNKNFSRKCLLFDKIYLKNYIKDKPYFITKSQLATKFLRKKGFEKVTTVGVGLDETKFKNNLDSKNEKEFILYIGTLDERRNILFLLRVFNIVVKKKTNMKLLLIGKGEKSYIEKINKYIRQNNLNNNIIYKESVNQSEIGEFYKKASLFLLPTNYEIFGMVMLEAMFFGVPVITSNNGGSSVLINNDYNGVIIDKFDEIKWSEKILEILNDPYNLNRISKNAKKTIEEKFTWDKISERFLENYRLVINEVNSKER